MTRTPRPAAPSRPSGRAALPSPPSPAARFPVVVGRLTATELRLNLREWNSTAFGLLLPVALMLGIGSIPGIDRPDPALGGRRGIDTWVPSLSVILSVAMLAWFVLPGALAGYRERGVLRRLAATPARPAALLAAQLLVNLLYLAVSAVAVTVIGTTVYGMSGPGNPPGLVAVLALGVPAVFGVGLLLAATLPSARAASGICWAVFAPSAFLAGIYVPSQYLPAAVRSVAGWTPLAAFRAALEDVWAGDAPHARHLAVLGITAVVTWLAAVRWFRTG